MSFSADINCSRQSSPTVRRRWLTIAGCILGILLLLRFVTIAHLPYLDPSESRYALVSKIMSEDGDLFTPKIYKDGVVIPFLSKPPLHFWLEAVSIEFFGMNQIAVRLPSFVSALIMLTLTCYTAFRLFNLEKAIISGLLLFTSGLFFYMAGSTLVDMTLSAAITGVMASFLLSSQEKLQNERVIWKYLFFFFLAMGMLTKGPIAIIFPGISILLWCAISSEWKLLAETPWLKGSLLFLAITAPVFLLIEKSNPGFLKYFFINENLLRYLIKDYGDRFGSGHRYPYGSSWLFLLASFFPWTLIFLPSLVGRIRSGLIKDKLLLYFVCWGFGPALFLTFARQLLGTYLLPSLGGLAIFTAVTYPRVIHRRNELRIASLFVLGVSLLVAISIALTIWSFQIGVSSEHVIISICLLVLLSICVVWVARQKYSFQVLATSCLALTIAYTSGIVSFCAYSGRFVSAGALMQKVDAHFDSSHPTLYFPFGVPLSAYLYQDKNENVIDGANGKTLSIKNNNTLIIVRDKQVEELNQRFGNNFNELLRIGKWRVFHKEQHKGSCEQAIERSHRRCTAHAYLRSADRHA